MGRKPGSLVTFKCRVCGVARRVSGGNSMFRCEACRRVPDAPGFRRHGWATTGKDEAASAIGRAIRDGLLPHPSTLRCADCSGPATEYEHRDYNAPLVVEPICRGCNLRRGPAIPLKGSIEAIVARGAVPYRLRRNVEKLLRAMGRPTIVLHDMPVRLGREHWLRLLPLIATEPTPATPTDAKAAA